MLKVKNGNISITRGDSAYLTITPEGYELSEGDEIRVQVREDMQRDSTLLFEGDVYVEGDAVVWHIRPIDTDDIEEGEYYWDAQLVTVSGDVFTYIAEKTFEVRPDTTN